MKKLTLVFVLLMSMVFTSCFHEDNFGYPKTIVLSNEGGEMTVTGDESFDHAEIVNHKTGADSEIIQYDENGEVIVLDWLKVEYTRTNSLEFKLYAEPNSTGKSRELCVELDSGKYYHEVKVKQEK